MTRKAVVLLSGGLDSSTTAAIAKHEDGYEVTALSFRYGQRHTIELEQAQKIANHFGLKHFVVDVNISQWGGSALTDESIDVPTSGTEDGVIPPTYVPGRNTVFISIGLSLAEAIDAEALYLGINAVDYSGYPDCRPEYLEAFQNLADLATKAGLEGRGAKLKAPLVLMTKVDIVKKALELGVPIDQTWSCYQGGTEPCGVCDSCRIRDKALIEAGRPDLASRYAQEHLGQQ
ncbi:7-cyano-7-deazaguanine synthase QueC [Deinococcus cellulosilyticus]|uniref:7-cyano-7-deazaguanine synthase n=1 Tax=Deinococcus cellulosilyticus (strain DSM 18568 / NBRC 106333 / KACC 11606 / 5516J-15) TaxID=1223518 RepID=A0A511MZT0_DEIC1|nr:7-cyano-7-deazaguanine synthase QueC [Deinococcus cellulosilyticus]GEM46052.1 7-cyano-7-deazaguanine synthase [Deinococcus cellulosilyticus NBRC 106333 = KACC 11606]